MSIRTPTEQSSEALLRQIEQLQELDQQKQQLIGSLSHELGNLLVPLKVVLHLAERPSEGFVPMVRETLQGQVEHLDAIVNNLRKLLRASRPLKLTAERCDLLPIVQRGVAEALPSIEQRDHNLQIDLPSQPLPVLADAEMLATAITELLNHAATTTPPGGQIALHVAAVDGHAELCVCDSGAGSAEEAAPHVFDPLRQLAETPRAGFANLELGLMLVRSIVDAHGGSVEARSLGPQQGSELVIRLAAAPAEGRATSGRQEPAGSESPARETSASAMSAEPANPRRILLVDDDLDAARSMKMLLEREGHDVQLKHDGESALEAIAQAPPDVVLLDLSLPGIDGYEVARRVRANPARQHIPLIALSGWGRNEDIQRAREVGFDRHLLKPVELRTLTRLLAELPRPQARHPR